MKAAVLNPGPSLIEAFTGHESEYAVKIGVNRAVNFFACDYWAMLDGLAFELAKPIGTPTVFCEADVWNREVLGKTEPAKRAIHFKNLPVKDTDFIKFIRGTKLYSFMAAIYLAHHLGATQIDCYGSDWSGEQDCDGWTHGHNQRGEGRWNEEREAYGIVTGRLAEFGVSVQRMSARMQTVATAAAEARMAEAAAL